MLELSFNSLLYLFYRLAPFILVCFFVLGSIINSEAKGFVYLVGLIFTATMSYGIIDLIGDDPEDTPSPACSTLKINGIYSDKTPISMVIFAYSFFYLVYPIAKHHIELDNIPTLIFFPLLILGDIYWNTMYECFSPLNMFLALIVGGGIGVGWSALIEKVNLKGLSYFNIGSNRERCSRATKGNYRCTTYRNGEKVQILTTAVPNHHSHKNANINGDDDYTGEVQHAHADGDEEHTH
jgi:hypothetical protein